MQIFRTLLLLLLTLTVVVSSTGLTVGMHLCAGKINDFNLFGEAQPCPMAQKQEKLPACHHSEKDAPLTEGSGNDCCQDQDLILDKVDLLTSNGKTLNLHPDLAFVAVVGVVWSFLFGMPQPVFIPHASYSPPALARNIPVLVQSFLL